MYIINNIYKPGDIVCSRKDPKKALVVRLYAYNVYYCNVKDHPEEKEKVYFEREIQLYKPSF